MNFSITTSTSCYKTKPCADEIRKMQYIRKYLSLDEIIDYIKHGYVLSANFIDENTIIKQFQRNYENYVGTHFIMLDLDGDIECSLGDLINELKIKPTIAYTTYNHQKEGKGNRYRLLFFFEEEIININTVKELYDKIIGINGLSISDNCGRNSTQAVLGSYEECELISTDIVYSLNHFQLNNENTRNGHSNDIKKEEKNNIRIECPIQDKEYITDYWNMSFSDLISKYNEKYYFFQHTPLPQVDDDTPYIILPLNFIEITRYWIYSIDYNEYGEERGRTSKARKIKDGEGRKKKLYINGILRRLMIEELTFEHLLHCLVNELYYFIDNNSSLNISFTFMQRLPQT